MDNRLAASGSIQVVSTPSVLEGKYLGDREEFQRVSGVAGCASDGEVQSVAVCSDEDANDGGVEECRSGEVDDDCLTRGVVEQSETSFERIPAREVELAGEVDDRRVAVQLNLD